MVFLKEIFEKLILKKKISSVNSPFVGTMGCIGLCYQHVDFGTYSANQYLHLQGHCEKTRIYHECESRIEKSVQRMAVWHHEACQVMTNGDPEGQLFLS